MKLKNWIIFISALLLLFCSSREPAKKKVSEGSGMKNDFTLKSLDNQTYTLSQLRGKVVLLDFWATWCPPCKKSIPIFIKLYNKYKEKGFMVLGIGLDEEEALRNYQSQVKIPYPILLGNKKVAKLYDVSAIPTMVIYDKKGKLVKRQVGMSPELEGQLDTFIDSLLSE